MSLLRISDFDSIDKVEVYLIVIINVKISDLFTESEKEDSEDKDDAAGEQTSSLPVQCNFSGDNEPFYLKESGVKGTPLYDTNTYNELEHIVSLTLVPCFDEVSTTTAETAD